MSVLVVDTDPGVDDMLALLLLLSAKPNQADIRMITLTHGNCKLKDALNNTLSLFKVIKQENEWRNSQNLPKVTEQLPTIHLGASVPLCGNHSESTHAADIHGNDGLCGIHTTNPEFDAPQEWFDLFKEDGLGPASLGFRASSKLAYLAILELLLNEPENTVTIIALGPLTNLAHAAKHDIKTFSRVKQVLSMGAALHQAGNISPLAEFNIYADPIAAALVYSLTSQVPKLTMPRKVPLTIPPKTTPLNLIIFPLNVTRQHYMLKSDADKEIGDVLRQYPESVLARWVQIWLSEAFVNFDKLTGTDQEDAKFYLHDPLTALYALSNASDNWVTEWKDVRVESEGQWARGLTFFDRRDHTKQQNIARNTRSWLPDGQGNRIGVIVDTPIKYTFGNLLLKRIIGV